MKSTQRWGILPTFLWVLLIPAQTFASVSFSIRDVPGDADFPEGADPGSIKYVCAENEAALPEIFRSRNLPFDPELVKNMDGKKCHVWYEPTLKGFRANPENDSIKGLIFNVDTLGYLSGRTEVVGDSLDIMKEMLPRIPRPLDITLGVNHVLEDVWYQEALKLHFDGSRHNIMFHQTKATDSNPWAQDYIKSGKVGENSVVLVPRRLLEGSPQYGERFRAFLDEIAGGSFIRSKLSWEGGDLMFLRHPGKPQEMIIFFGDSAKNYWGKELTYEEYAYILKLEFGAENAVNLSGLAAHIDYFVSFIPDENIALVSDPITGSQGLAFSALEAIGQRLKNPYTNEIIEMARTLSISAADFRKSRKEIRAALDKLKISHQTLQIEEKIGMMGRLENYVRQNCIENPESCFVGSSRQEMFEKDLPLVRDMVSSAAVMRTDVAQIPAFLSIIESQLPDFDIPDRKLRERKIAELESLGLRVIRVPRIAGDKSLQVPWSGISYVNSLLVDHTLFIPVIGLTEIEDLFLSDLRSQLPPDYNVVPVYARTMILNNGGIHCATGIVRGF